MLSTRYRLLSTVKQLQNCRYFVSSAEVRIPVPWGHIAGKWWGPQDKRPILTMHGWQDNCGSFDLLIPILPKHLSYLTIDFPGHGLSSKLPAGMFYHSIFSSIIIRNMQIFFNWDKVSLMGHSLGAMCSYMFGILYPSQVDFMICIDGLHPPIRTNLIERASKTIDEFIKYDAYDLNVSDLPSYTMDDMIHRLHFGSRKSIDVDKCKYILKRNVKPAPEAGKFIFNRDSRVKCSPLLGFSANDLLEGAKRVSFPFFLSKAEHSPFRNNEVYFDEVFNVVKRNGKDCQFVKVPGQHHGHLNTPEIYKDILTAFILLHDTEDRSKGGMPKSILAL